MCVAGGVVDGSSPSESAMVVVAGLIVLAAAVTGVRLALRGRTPFLGLTAAIAGALVGAGALGTFANLALVVETVNLARPEHQRLFLRAGVALAARPTVLALIAVGVLGPLNRLAAGREPQMPDRWRWAARLVQAPIGLALSGLGVAGMLIAVAYLRAGSGVGHLTTGVVVGSISAIAGIAGALAAAVFSAIVAANAWGMGDDADAA